jgi:hypothetical protein
MLMSYFQRTGRVEQPSDQFALRRSGAALLACTDEVIE